MRYICRGQDKPIEKLYRQFNEETADGWNMTNTSELVSEAINSIIEVKEENDIDTYSRVKALLLCCRRCPVLTILSRFASLWWNKDSEYIERRGGTQYAGLSIDNGI